MQSIEDLIGRSAALRAEAQRLDEQVQQRQHAQELRAQAQQLISQAEQLEAGAYPAAKEPEKPAAPADPFATARMLFSPPASQPQQGN